MRCHGVVKTLNNYLVYNLTFSHNDVVDVEKTISMSLNLISSSLQSSEYSLIRRFPHIISWFWSLRSSNRGRSTLVFFDAFTAFGKPFITFENRRRRIFTIDLFQQLIDVGFLKIYLEIPHWIVACVFRHTFLSKERKNTLLQRQKHFRTGIVDISSYPI